jgi:aminocarboxymuconate-semialdehyde decarboxylase
MLMSRIDLHTHILPERWPDWTARTGYPGWISLEHHKPCCARMCQSTSVDGSTPPKFFREIESNCWDPAKRLQEMNATGVSMQVLSTVPVMFSYWAKPRDAYDLSRLLNDHVAQCCRDHPQHFAGLGTIPMQDASLACEELERCVRQLGLRGVQIGTHVNGLNLDAPSVREIFAHAERLGACVFVHPWDMLAPERMSRYWMPWLVGMPTETTIAIMSVLFGGVLDAHPKLKLCFAHAGGSLPGTIGRIVHGFESRRDLFPAHAKHPREHLAHSGNPASFYVDSLTHDEHALREIVRLFDARRVALGSDYPFPLGEAKPGAMINAMHDLSEPTKRQLLELTARNFLGL